MEAIRPAERRAWFERSVVALLPALAGAARRLTRNTADAEDLVADTVARAWSSLETLEDPASLRGWIFRIMTNRFLSDRRARKARPVLEPLPEEEDGQSAASFSLFEQLHQPFLLWWGGNPEQEFLNKLLREDVERAVAALAEPFRVVLVLADIEGFTYQEIADTLGVPIGTVRSRLARARGQLQKALWTHRSGPSARRGPLKEA